MYECQKGLSTRLAITFSDKSFYTLNMEHVKHLRHNSFIRSYLNILGIQ